MEKTTITEHPDGTVTTITEKSGFVLRDGIIGLIGAGAGALLGIASVPALSTIIPETVLGSTMARKAAVGVGAFTVGEIAEHSTVRALTETCEFSDRIQYELARKRAVVAVQQVEDAKSDVKSSKK